MKNQKNQKIQDLSTEALLKRKKTTELVTGLLIGMLTALVVMAILLSMKNGFAMALPYFIMPLGLSPIVFISVADIKAVKKELQARGHVL